MKSMTGYGKGERADDKRKVVIEIKSVNNRFLDISTRFPKSLSFVEEAVKKQVQSTINRGSIDILYTYTLIGESDKTLNVDMNLVKEYYDASMRILDNYNVVDDVSVLSLLKMPDVINLTAAEGNRDEITALFAEATADAVKELDKMRIIEGNGIKADFIKLIGNIQQNLNKVIERAPEIVNEHKAKMQSRIAELMDGTPIDEARVAMEVAIFSDKCDINEEISRLSSHIEQFLNNLESKEPQGRRLDFLAQEMNREINTMGSKANDLTLTKLVIEMKNELEKIKEQIRNVE